MPDPKIRILGDASGATAAFNEAIAGAEKLGKSTDGVAAGFGRARIAGVRLKAVGGSFAPLAAGLVVASQASRELADQMRVTGDEALTTTGRFRNAGAQLLGGNVIGAFKALTPAVQAPAEALDKLLNRSIAAGNQVELDALKAIAASEGWKELGKQLDVVSASASAAASALAVAGQQAQLGGAAARTGLTGDALEASQFGERTDRFGRGVGAVAESNTRAGGGLTAAVSGLPQNLRTAIAGARAGGNVKNIIAQLSRGKAALEKQKNQANLTDADREKIFDGITAIDAEIASLGKTAAKAVGGVLDGFANQELDARLSGKASRLKAVLEREATFLRSKIPGANSETRVKLKEALLGVQKEITSINDAAADALKASADAIKKAGQAILSSALDALGRKQDTLNADRGLVDARRNLKLAKQLGAAGPNSVAVRAFQDAQIAKQRSVLESATVSAGKNGTFNFDGATFHFHGVQNVKQLLAELQKVARGSAPSQRGRMPGHHLGL